MSVVQELVEVQSSVRFCGGYLLLEHQKAVVSRPNFAQTRSDDKLVTVPEFGYLGDMLFAWGSCELAVVTASQAALMSCKIFNIVVCATSKGSDQPAHTRSLIRAFACHLNIL